MDLQTIRRHITVEEYHRMSEARIFREDERLELIDGEIIKMTPIGVKHASCVNRLAEFFIQRLAARAIVSIQNPVCLGEHSEPEPDIAILQRDEKSYMTRRPNAGDVYLIMEFADGSVEFDRKVKLPVYARVGIPEVWIVDLVSDYVEIYRTPTFFGYESVAKKQGSDVIAPSSFPDVVVTVDWIVGKLT